MEDMERSASRRRSRGFTLTEMLAGIAMLAILAGLLIPSAPRCTAGSG